MSRLRWAGHVQRMNVEDILKGIIDCKPEGRRGVERPKLRWIGGVLEHIQKLGVRNCWTVARDREAWRKVLREAKADVGLYSSWP